MAHLKVTTKITLPCFKTWLFKCTEYNCNYTPGCTARINHENKGRHVTLDLVHNLSPVHRDVSADSDSSPFQRFLLTRWLQVCEPPYWHILVVPKVNLKYRLPKNRAIVLNAESLANIWSLGLFSCLFLVSSSAGVNHCSDDEQVSRLAAICVCAGGHRPEMVTKKEKTNRRIFAPAPIKTPINAHLQWPRFIVSNPHLFLIWVKLTGRGETSPVPSRTGEQSCCCTGCRSFKIQSQKRDAERVPAVPCDEERARCQL